MRLRECFIITFPKDGGVCGGGGEYIPPACDFSYLILPEACVYPKCRLLSTLQKLSARKISRLLDNLICANGDLMQRGYWDSVSQAA